MASRNFFSDEEKSCVLELVRKHKLHLSTTMSGSPSAKKNAWDRLTQEFNILNNSRRTELQLKRCWSNIKSRKKTALNLEKKERMRTGGGPYRGPATTDLEGVEDALTASTDLELRFAMDCDTMPCETPADVLEFHPTDEVPAPAPVAQGPPENNVTDLASANSQFCGKDVRAQVIIKEYEARAKNLKQSEEREEELHQLKVKNLKRNEEREEALHQIKMQERKLATSSKAAPKAAEEAYERAKLERLSAAQLLQFSQATREAAEKK